MKKTILISGINGFLGSNIAKKLSVEYNIIGLANDLNNLNRLRGYDFLVYESIDENFVKIFKKHEIFSVIHAATVYRLIGSIHKMLDSNILLPIKLYELANKSGVKLFFNTDTFFNNPDFEYGYLNEYTLSKKHCLEWLKTLISSCRLINVKLFHMYGPNDSPSKFVNNVFNELQNNVASIDLTMGEQKRDFIYIDDVVEAYCTLLRTPYTTYGSYEEYQVGSSFGTSIRDFVEKMKLQLKSDTLLNFGVLDYRNNEIMNSIADNSKLTQLGWNPNYDIDSGIKEILKQY